MSAYAARYCTETFVRGAGPISVLNQQIDACCCLKRPEITITSEEEDALVDARLSEEGIPQTGPPARDRREQDRKHES